MDFVIGFTTYVGNPSGLRKYEHVLQSAQPGPRRPRRRQWVGFTSDSDSTSLPDNPAPNTSLPTALCIGEEIDRRGVDPWTPSSSLLFRGRITAGPENIRGLQVWIKAGRTPERIDSLRREAQVYDSLKDQQGILVPRSLGLFHRKERASHPIPKVSGTHIPYTILVLADVGPTLSDTGHAARSALHHLGENPDS
ncbi:hypothetical protein EXIGLDRAFT_765666 [Exidia glandulosa HHB12029]|uniref:Uncharacterized protein n=1 Tax=Exidia glandulosa HHB12029 TaxID=1314781 RepID=A0A165K8X4_EXIGL|nr:hypothetical protein EXIGLDRAFT_765666 [Exidia glandulosa HHB12029]